MVAVKVSASFSARPPETMIFAEVSSGRSLLAISEPTKLERPASVGPLTASTEALPPVGFGEKNFQEQRAGDLAPIPLPWDHPPRARFVFRGDEYSRSE